MKKLLLVLTGPTASGKTEIAIYLAKYFKTEIVSADSRQIFSEMTIGTAKPSPDQLKETVHHFIGSHSIQDDFNAGKYAVECRKLLELLFIKHDVVILTGGSGLYIDAVINGFDNFPDTDPHLRKLLKKELEHSGIIYLQEKLKSLDPESYKAIDLNNPQRVMRAVEVSISSGKPYSSFLNQKKNDIPFDVIFFGVQLDRTMLYKRINNRVDDMLTAGLLEEVKNLMPYKNKQAMQTVGYAELILFLEGKLTFENAIEKIKQHTRNYAKRQITWFNKNKSIHWINPEDKQIIIDFIIQKLA